MNLNQKELCMKLDLFTDEQGTTIALMPESGESLIELPLNSDEFPVVIKSTKSFSADSAVKTARIVQNADLLMDFVDSAESAISRESTLIEVLESIKQLKSDDKSFEDKLDFILNKAETLKGINAKTQQKCSALKAALNKPVVIEEEGAHE